MNFIKRLKKLSDSSEDKDLEKFRNELTERKKKVEEYTDNQKKEGEGFLLQRKGMDFYSDKQFDKAERYLLQAMDKGFYSPGGLICLAKIYRKRKDYNNEVRVLENGLQHLKSDKENNYGKNISKVQERLSKAKQYKEQKNSEK